MKTIFNEDALLDNYQYVVNPSAKRKCKKKTLQNN